jgi:hypothetical protein
MSQVGGGVCDPSALVWGRSVWSPHGLGVRRENGSADGAGRKRRFQAVWGGGGKFCLNVEVVGRCWLLWGAHLVRRAPAL